MIALNILDVKTFMSKLLVGDIFDNFYLSEASITTYVTFSIDGSLHKEFFDTALADSLHLEERSYTLWKEVKPFCFSVMKGKHTPLHFKIVFLLSGENITKLLIQSGISYTPDDIFGLYLNFQFDGSHLSCTTGSSLRMFSLDKSLDRVWDDMVIRFFQQQEIPAELN